MRYLKLYEGFNTEDYYKTIDEDEFDEIHFIDVDRKYFQQIRREKTKHVLKYVKDPDSDDQQMIIIGETPSLKFLSNGQSKKSQTERSEFLSNKPEYLLKFEIYEGEDDWFVVCILNVETFVYHYYKCDQWDGVIQLLKDKNIIK